MAKTKSSFPATIYVSKEKDADGAEFFLTDEVLENLVPLNNPVVIGVYKLVAVKTAKTEVIVED
jgi:hypothetical protein